MASDRLLDAFSFYNQSLQLVHPFCQSLQVRTLAFEVFRSFCAARDLFAGDPGSLFVARGCSSTCCTGVVCSSLEIAQRSIGIL